MEEEMIKDVAHTFGRGSLDMRRIILHRRWSERTSKESVGETRGRAALMRIKSLKEATKDELE